MAFYITRPPTIPSSSRSTPNTAIGKYRPIRISHFLASSLISAGHQLAATNVMPISTTTTSVETSRHYVCSSSSCRRTPYVNRAHGVAVSCGDHLASRCIHASTAPISRSRWAMPSHLPFSSIYSYTSDDRVSTAVKHWQLNTIVRAFSQWRWFVDAQKAAEEGDEHRLLPPAPGLSLFQPPTTSEGAQDAGTKEYDDDEEEEEEEDADGRSGEPSEEESEDSNDDAKTSNKRKRGDDKEVEEEHELERDAKEEQEPHSGEAEHEGEAEKKQNNDKEEMLHQEEEVVGEEDAPAPVFATPPPPQRRTKRRKGLLADLDMDGPSLR